MGNNLAAEARILAESRGWKTAGLTENPLENLRYLLLQRGHSSETAEECVKGVSDIVESLTNKISDEQRTELIQSIFTMYVLQNVQDSEYARENAHYFPLKGNATTGSVQTMESIFDILLQACVNAPDKKKPKFTQAIQLCAEIRGILLFDDEDKGPLDSLEKAYRDARAADSDYSELRDGVRVRWYDRAENKSNSRNRTRIKYVPCQPPGLAN